MLTDQDLPWDATPFLPPDQQERGKPLEGTSLAPYVVATVHPASILRAPDPETRESEGRAFVEDLRTVKRLLE